MSLGTIQSGYPMNPRAAKAQIAAAYNGLEVAVDCSTPLPELFAEGSTYKKKFPLAKVPVFEGENVDLFESTAIAYYAAASKENSPLLGTTAAEKASILQWVFFAENDVTGPLSAYLLPIFFPDRYPYTRPTSDAAVANLKRSLTFLDQILLTKTYLVNEQVTFADIALVCALTMGFKRVIDKEYRAQYKNITRYYTTLVNKEHFKKYLGEIEYCDVCVKFTPPKKEKKEEKKPEPKVEKKEKPAAKADDDLDEPKPEPKPKSALDLLPPSPFVMDAWKRMYSNNDTDVAMKWFWENHDPTGYSIWKADYKYNDELTKVFMSNNLIGGFYARLERAHKYAFGSMIVRGTDNNNSISGYWLLRGQEVPFEVYDAADFGSYEFKKIEPSQYEEKKKEIEDYMSWNFEDFADGKIFK